MVSITLSVPKEVREQMKKFPEINWSGFVRASIEAKAKRLIWKEQMLKQLESEKGFDKHALEIGDNIKKGMWKEYKAEDW